MWVAKNFFRGFYNSKQKGKVKNMNISKVSVISFSGATQKQAVKNLANKVTQGRVDFSQFAYSVPEEAIAKKAPRIMPDMSPKQINVKEIMSSNRKAPEEKKVNVVLESTIL